MTEESLIGQPLQGNSERSRGQILLGPMQLIGGSMRFEAFDVLLLSLRAKKLPQANFPVAADGFCLLQCDTIHTPHQPLESNLFFLDQKLLNTRPFPTTRIHKAGDPLLTIPFNMFNVHGVWFPPQE